MRRLRCLFGAAETSLLLIYNFQLNLYRYLSRNISFGPGSAATVRKLYKDIEEDVELLIFTNAVINKGRVIKESSTIAARKYR